MKYITNIKFDLINGGKTLAYATITINDCFVIKYFRIMKIYGKIVVKYPQIKLAETGYKNIISFKRTFLKDELDNHILEAFFKITTKYQSKIKEKTITNNSTYPLRIEL